MKILTLLGLLAYGSSALAGNLTVLETPVTYHANAGVIENVKTECRLEEQFENRIGKVLAKMNKSGNGTLAKDANASDVTLLRLQITHVLGVGGGVWTGPKAITVTADLIENGKVARHTKINRWSVGGMWGGFKGTCSILNRNVEAIGKDLSRWIRDPSYQIVDEPAPKEENANSETDKKTANSDAVNPPPSSEK